MLEPSIGGGGIEHYIYQIAKFGVSTAESAGRSSELEVLLVFREGQEIPKWAEEKAIIYKKRFPFLDRHIGFIQFLYGITADIYFFPTGMAPYGFKRPYAVTIHDLAILKHPEWFPAQWFATRFVLPYSIRNASKVISVSKHTAMDIAALFPKVKKAEVIYLGFELIEISKEQVQSILRKHALKEQQYFFFVGTVEPRKNIIRLIQAHQQSGAEFPLVIAGRKGWKYQDILDTMEHAKEVKYIGYISEEEKQALIKNAKALLWPSLYEGFGLPVLEAYSLGTPVLTSQGTSMEEIVGDNAILVAPEDVESIKNGILRLDGLKVNADIDNHIWERTSKATFDYLTQ